MNAMRDAQLLALPSKVGLSLEAPEDTFPAHGLTLEPVDLAHRLPARASAELAVVAGILVPWRIVTRRLNAQCLKPPLLGTCVLFLVSLRRSRWSWRCIELRGVVVVTPMLDLLHGFKTTNSFDGIVELIEGYKAAEKCAKCQ